MNDSANMKPMIIVVGASAGGVEAIRELARGLMLPLSAAVLVVCHTAANGAGELARVLDKGAPVRVRFASDGEPIEAGTIRVAPPDMHLMLAAQRLRLTRGPKHNRARPS